jgi:two-component system, sensor histidine kinase PdtaS
MVSDQNLKEILNVSCNRIYSLALIHEKLQESENVSSVNLNSYFQRLLDIIRSSYQTIGKEIIINLNVEMEIELPTDQSIQLGLILNELVSNIFKYAFPDNRQGIITINFDMRNQVNYFLVKDNGIGFPDGFDIQKSSSLGLKIVKLFVGQLHGELTYKNKNGAEFNIKFPYSS